MPQRIPPFAERSVELPSAPAESLAEAAEELIAAAHRLGFAPVGLAPAQLPDADRARLAAWLDAGRHGTMTWLGEASDDRCDAATVLEGAQSVLMVGLAYEARTELPADDAARGIVSTYAQGHYDYHRVLAIRLEHLARAWRALVPGAEARRFCDTTPLLERAFALQAGLGFVGKNTQVIDPERGSYFFLGGLILDRELPATARAELPSCGSCTRCLDVCPTDAFPAPYVLDAARCISYLTIEHRGPWPEALRAPAGRHIFGCDLCQVVCPWNEKFAAPADPELTPVPERVDPPLLELSARAQQGFKSIARHTPWSRTGKSGFLRNLANAMGNAGGDDVLEALRVLLAHPDPGVAEHARWALDRQG